ncbi:hypothetical protein [Helicobacter sp. MIT 14-3879]|uniref:hypothetical protein n=1 Tax=Helicobacter sp. MIT 14-3879 TaxID=2040649 RepID=UPI0015F187C4|nr:hypothetical protein [Helicobacter sp. MIT 14-3879]
MKEMKETKETKETKEMTMIKEIPSLEVTKRYEYLQKTGLFFISESHEFSRQSG